MRKQFTPKYKGTPGPKCDQTQVTVPDQNLTIRQLLDNHSRGLPMGAAALRAEFFDTEIPVIQDLTDIPKYKKSLQKKEKALKAKLKAEKEEREFQAQIIAGTEDIKPPKKVEQ